MSNLRIRGLREQTVGQGHRRSRPDHCSQPALCQQDGTFESTACIGELGQGRRGSGAKDGVVVEEQMHYVKVKDFKKEAIKYSVKHQVLSEFTAFLCVGKELVDGQYQEFKNKGVNKIHVEQH